MTAKEISEVFAKLRKEGFEVYQAYLLSAQIYRLTIYNDKHSITEVFNVSDDMDIALFDICCLATIQECVRRIQEMEKG